VRFKKRPRRIFYRINWQIRAQEIRLIDGKGEQLGVFPIAEARKIAKDRGFDLVEIAPNAKPPVVKLIDYNKFKYQENKKRKEERKKEKGGIKEIRVTPFIAEADFLVRIKRAKRFLKKDKKIRLVIRFLGRQIVNKEFGYQMIEKFKKAIEEEGEQEGQPRLMGKRLIVFFKPK
jgi:translation initiation factor IF-3